MTGIKRIVSEHHGMIKASRSATTVTAVRMRKKMSLSRHLLNWQMHPSLLSFQLNQRAMLNVIWVSQADAIEDSDDEVDHSKIDLGNKKEHIG